MKIILVRHGRSLANESKKHQGKKDKWRDTQLHDKGISQSKKISNELKNEKIDEIYSSPLKRTLETTKEINKNHKLKINIEPRIEEKHDKESKEKFIERCESFFNEISKKEGNILVVSHGGVILTLLAISTGNRKKGGELVRKYVTRIKNTSISIIEKNNGKFKRTLIGFIKD
jgi:broad specificity phosphatase PhoE